MTESKRKVILVTDGDNAARKAIETAARNVGARCISRSAGNPTLLTGEQILAEIKKAPHDPVVVMVDDRGREGRGKGERALSFLATHEDIEVIGVLAVASNAGCGEEAEVDLSVDRSGRVTGLAVDKQGYISAARGSFVSGDTLSVLDGLAVPVIVGIGDIGKMDGADDPLMGSPLTTRALKEIIERHDSHGGDVLKT